MTSAVSAACPQTPSDEQLLARYASGDREVLEELFRRYRGPAFRVAHRLLGQEADALDAVQEGFVKALTHIDTFKGRSSFKTWLLRVVSNAALDLGRQRGRREVLSLNGSVAADGVLGHPSRVDNPAARLEQEDLRRRLDAALTVLSDVQRQTFVLHAEAGLSYREVAEALDISIGTVMSRLYYARQRLRARLGEQSSPSAE